MATSWESLNRALMHWAEYSPDKKAYAFLPDGENEGGAVSYAELWASASSLARTLNERLGAGSRVLLMYSDGLDFIVAFFGCLCGGIVPVPVYPPRRNRRLDVCGGVAADCSARAVLTTAADAKHIEHALQSHDYLRTLPVVLTDAELTPQAGPLLAVPAASSLAFLQYTSGSTGQPKGVVVTHGNLINNARAVQQAFGHDETTIFVGWLPLFHDMGLIGNVLQPMYLGITSYLMPPSAFLQKPVRWLRAITRYGATTSGAPNFAYGLCAKKVKAEDKASLDLRSWRVAFNGSEPVRAETLGKFSAAFAECGFDPQSHYPCYGMAETTLLLTGPERGRCRIDEVDGNALEQHVAQPAETSESAVAVASCGRAWEGNRIRIVEPESRRHVEDGRVGEIWAQGPSVALGYWNKPELTRERFGAMVSDDPGSGDWYRTGDLGYVSKGDTFVTGRLKDLVIIRGRNHYPQDIEATVEGAHADVAAGRVAAFAIVRDEEEQLVIVLEVELAARAHADATELEAAVREAVTGAHQVAPCDIVVLAPTAVPLTSSGKVQRAKCRSSYLAGSLAVFQPRRSRVAE